MTKLVKYKQHTYEVMAKPIKSIDFEVKQGRTRVSVNYKGVQYPDYVFSIDNAGENVDTALLSDVYVSIMTLNKELLK